MSNTRRSLIKLLKKLTSEELAELTAQIHNIIKSEHSSTCYDEVLNDFSLIQSSSLTHMELEFMLDELTAYIMSKKNSQIVRIHKKMTSIVILYEMGLFEESKAECNILLRECQSSEYYPGIMFCLDIQRKLTLKGQSLKTMATAIINSYKKTKSTLKKMYRVYSLGALKDYMICITSRNVILNNDRCTKLSNIMEIINAPVEFESNIIQLYQKTATIAWSRIKVDLDAYIIHATAALSLQITDNQYTITDSNKLIIRKNLTSAYCLKRDYVAFEDCLQELINCKTYNLYEKNKKTEYIFNAYIEMFLCSGKFEQGIVFIKANSNLLKSQGLLISIFDDCVFVTIAELYIGYNQLDEGLVWLLALEREKGKQIRDDASTFSLLLQLYIHVSMKNSETFDYYSRRIKYLIADSSDSFKSLIKEILKGIKLLISDRLFKLESQLTLIKHAKKRHGIDLNASFIIACIESHVSTFSIEQILSSQDL